MTVTPQPYSVATMGRSSTASFIDTTNSRSIYAAGSAGLRDGHPVAVRPSRYSQTSTTSTSSSADATQQPLLHSRKPSSTRYTRGATTSSIDVSSTNPDRYYMSTSKATVPAYETSSHLHSTLPETISELRKDVKPKKKSSWFSFAPFSRQSTQAILKAQAEQKEEDTPQQVHDVLRRNDSPGTSVNKWMATFEEQSDRSSSLGSTSATSSSVPAIPNAHKVTTSLTSRQSTRKSLASSRTSSKSNMSSKDGRSSRTGNSQSMLDVRSGTAKGDASESMPLPGPARAASPTPSQYTRCTSISSTHAADADVIICDAAATSYFVAGRPRSVYDHRMLIQEPSTSPSAEPAAPSTQAVQRKPVAVTVTRPRPQVLQLQGSKPKSRSQFFHHRSNSPASSLSSVPSLSASAGTPNSLTPPTSPGTPDTTYVGEAFNMGDAKRIPTTWLGLDAEEAALGHLVPFSTSVVMNQRMTSQRPILPPRESSLLPGLAKTQKAALVASSAPVITTGTAEMAVAGAIAELLGGAASAAAVSTAEGGAKSRPQTNRTSTTSTISSTTSSALSSLSLSHSTTSASPRPNPYTTSPTAPFPTPTSLISPTATPGAGIISSRTSPEPSYFRLPASSSAHPSLYPDLSKAGMVGMSLTEEEAELIARMRRKRAAMRREELERLRVALQGGSGGLSAALGA